MKLSEAILEGCKTTKPSTSNFIYIAKNGAVCACALGAALYVIDPEIVEDYRARQRSNLPQSTINNLAMSRLVSFYPDQEDLLVSVMNLNDSEQKTREEIADWLEGQGF